LKARNQVGASRLLLEHHGCDPFAAKPRGEKIGSDALVAGGVGGVEARERAQVLDHLAFKAVPRRTQRSVLRDRSHGLTSLPDCHRVCVASALRLIAFQLRMSRFKSKMIYYPHVDARRSSLLPMACT